MEQDYKLELSQMEHRLTEMEEKIDAINTKLTQVVDAILGNPLTKAGGFIHDIDVVKAKVEKLEKKQLEYDDFKKKFTWIVGIIIAIGILIQYITTIYANVTK